MELEDFLYAGRNLDPSAHMRTAEALLLATGPGRRDVAGGKLTTCRLMAEHTANRVVRRLGRRAAPCRTAVEPLLRDGAARPFTGIVPPAVS